MARLLLASRDFYEEATRTDLIRDVERQLDCEIHVTRNNNPNREVTRIVQACSQREGGLDALVQAVRRIIGDSLPYREFEEACRTAGTEATTAGRGVPIIGRASRRRIWALGGIGLAVIPLLVVTAINLRDSGNRVPDAQVVHEIASAELTASSSPCSGHPDKLDLDTNERGRGDLPQLPGCTAPGRRAELILDPERLHTPSDNPLLRPLDPGTDAGWNTCYRAIGASSSLRGSIPISELNVGDQICVKTDEGLIALVSIKTISTGSARLTFSATVWKPAR